MVLRTSKSVADRDEDHVALVALQVLQVLDEEVLLLLGREQGLELEAALADNDAYPCLEQLGALIRTGPTGTNLNDLVVGLVYAS